MLLWIIIWSFVGFVAGRALGLLILFCLPLLDELWCWGDHQVYKMTARRRKITHAPLSLSLEQMRRLAEVNDYPGIPAQDAVDGLARLHQVLRGSAKKDE